MDNAPSIYDASYTLTLSGNANYGNIHPFGRAVCYHIFDECRGHNTPAATEVDDFKNSLRFIGFIVSFLD